MSELVFPADRPVFGCLKRKEPPGTFCSLAREKIKLIPRQEWAGLAAKMREEQANLRRYVKTILDQDGVGSCATESTTQSVMVARAIAGLPHVLLNPWFIYHTTSHGRDQGSSIDENLAFARDNGIAPEVIWPRSKGWKAEPSAEAKEAAKEFRIAEFFDVLSTDEAGSALVSGWSIVYGAKGHSVLKIEYDLDANSWGTGWEDEGFGLWCALERIDFRYGTFATRTPTEVK